MWPEFRRIIEGITSFMPNIRPWTLMSNIRRAVASSSSMKRPRGMIPALLMRTSTGPSRSSTWLR